MFGLSSKITLFFQLFLCSSLLPFFQQILVEYLLYSKHYDSHQCYSNKQHKYDLCLHRGDYQMVDVYK